MFENFVLVFSNPIIKFLSCMFIGTVIVNQLFKFLFGKGIVSSFSDKSFVASLSALMILVFALLYGFSSPQTVLAEEPPVVVAVEPRPTPQPTAPPTCIFQYPENIEPWCFLIEEAALRYGVDPYLIGAVMTQESGGNKEAGQTIQIIDGVEYHTSSSGAVGLVQVMPRDGIAADFICVIEKYDSEGKPYYVNVPCFGDRPTIKELLDPAFNVDYGTNMLRGLINKYGGTREGLRHYGPDCTLHDPLCDEYFYADLVLAIYEDIKPNP